MKNFAALTALMVAFTGFTSAAHAEGKADRYCDDDYAKKTYSSAAYTSASNQGDYVKTAANDSANRVVTKVSTSVGQVFANAQGMTLYTFTKDSNGASVCYDACADSWPPFLAQQNAKTWGEFTVIARNDGTYQWAYKNQPLYLWVGDRQQGDATGHGVGNVWYVAQP
ncbi:COG4315 family predicted lipoprotein [Hahella sp. NBU794]|uniref:COG4315 family predicted lipoprotein n=1 Tax=Hahella sp. NBU794 TaxID=3422590 RepID=UPI003D6DBFE3